MCLQFFIVLFSFHSDLGILAKNDAEKLFAWKQHYKRLLNQEFEWDSESLHFEEPVVGPPPQISLGSVK